MANPVTSVIAVPALVVDPFKAAVAVIIISIIIAIVVDWIRRITVVRRIIGIGLAYGDAGNTNADVEVNMGLGRSCGSGSRYENGGGGGCDEKIADHGSSPRSGGFGGIAGLMGQYIDAIP